MQQRKNISLISLKSCERFLWLKYAELVSEQMEEREFKKKMKNMCSLTH